MFEKLLRKFLKYPETNTPVTCQQTVTAPVAQLNVLERLEQEKDLSVLPDCYWLILTGDRNSKLRVVEALGNIIGSHSITLLSRIDLLCRARSSINWYHDWRNENPYNLIDPSMGNAERAILLGLASFHPNGYFREKAVKELIKISSGHELPYLLLRLNDWVGVIRTLARKALIERLNVQNVSFIVDSLPLIIRLQNCMRFEHKDIIDEVISLLSQKEAEFALKQGINSRDVDVRRYCYRIVVQVVIWDGATILNCLIKETNSQVKLDTLRRIEGKIIPEVFEDYAENLLSDRYAPVRALALDMLCRLCPTKSLATLEKSLLDDHISIRETARYLIKKQHNYDFASLYRKALSDGNIRCGAVLGLGETGDKEDAVYIIPFLDDERATIVRTCIKALSKLDFMELKDTFISMLADPRAGVSKEVRQALKSRLTIIDAERVYDIYKQSCLSHIRRNTAILLCSLSKWDSIKYILELQSDFHEEIRNVAKVSFVRWKLKFNRSFVSPSDRQIVSVEQALDRFGQSINCNDKEWLEFIMNGLKKKN